MEKTSGWYEMFYRGYDPAIGRMLQVDPYAPMYASHTTYNYAVNNPVMVNDPSGGQAALQNDYGVSAMGVNRYNRIAGMSDAGDYYADWGEDFSFFENTMGGHFSWFEYTSFMTNPTTGETYDHETWVQREWVADGIDHFDFQDEGDCCGGSLKTYIDIESDATARTPNLRALSVDLRAKKRKEILSNLLSAAQAAYESSSTNFRGHHRNLAKGMAALEIAASINNVLDKLAVEDYDSGWLELGKSSLSLWLGPELAALDAFITVGKSQMGEMAMSNFQTAKFYYNLAETYKKAGYPSYEKSARELADRHYKMAERGANTYMYGD